MEISSEILPLIISGVRTCSGKVDRMMPRIQNKVQGTDKVGKASVGENPMKLRLIFGISARASPQVVTDVDFADVSNEESSKQGRMSECFEKLYTHTRLSFSCSTFIFPSVEDRITKYD